MLLQRVPLSRASVDRDAELWARAAGAVSGLQKQRVSKLVRSLKACGAWALTDDYALHAVENQTQALVTLKRRITQTLAHVTSTNAAFVPFRGFLGNHDGYIDTGWNPASGSPQYTQNNARFGAWVYSMASVGNDSMMGNEDSNTNQAIKGTSAWRYGVNTASLPNSSTQGTGLNVFERTGASAEAAYLNGAANGTDTGASIAISNRNFYVLATNNGTVAHVSDFGISCSLYGASLTNAAMYAAEYAAFRAYMTSVDVP